MEQLELISGIGYYRREVERQAQLLANQREVMKESQRRMNGLSDSVQATTAAVSQVDADHERARLRREILQPVFQVSGEDAVGSAVLVHRGEDEDGSYYLALSCYHVLRDIVHFEESKDPHSVLFDAIFDQLPGGEQIVQARMLAENIPADLALLRIDTELELGGVARIAPLERERVVAPFSPIYTVGCPLGTSAQATRGEVTRDDWLVDGQNYWMVSSPAYFGNSGGGVFLSEGNELVGIFSKIYTHGNYRPQVVTHMGLAVPLSTIHAWLVEVGYGELLPQDAVVVEVDVEEASTVSGPL